MRKMKGFGALFTMVGTVIGAGFVSGRELLQFFGCFRISTVYCTGLLFFFSFLLCVRLGKIYGGFEGALKGVFGRLSRFVKAVILFGSFVSCAGMLSGLNSLLPHAKPFLSLAFLVFACFVSEKGVKGIGTVNMIVMPAVLLSVTALIFSSGALSPSEPPKAGFGSLLSMYLYISMNTFLSMPVLCDLGAELKDKPAALCCLVSSLIVALAVGLILSAVCSDKSSFAYDLPLSYVLGGVKLFPLIAGGGMLTTLLSSFYPLYTLAGRKLGIAGKWILFALTECAYFISFKSIVATVYPVLGVFGMGMAAVCAAVYFGKTTVKKEIAAALSPPRGRKKRVAHKRPASAERIKAVKYPDNVGKSKGVKCHDSVGKGKDVKVIPST